VNANLARQLTATAAAAAGVPQLADSISSFSEQQNGAGAHLSKHQMLAFLRNSLTEEIAEVYEGFLAGEPDAANEYSAKMTALKDILNAWAALNSAHKY
jgi:hypothetical protein